MKIAFPFILSFAVAVGALTGPLQAQQLVPPTGSAAQKAPASNGPVHLSAAPRVPVVQASRNAHAQKAPAAKAPAVKAPVAKTTKPTAKPAAKAPAKPASKGLAGAAAGVAAGAAAGAAASPATPTPAPEPTTPALPALDPTKGSTTGNPLPRFMSLRFDDVNLRVGPGTRYPIEWVYHRRDLPVEIIRELDDWRLVQDQDNIRGWMRAPTLSPRRGIVVRGAERILRASAADDASPVARLKPGVVGRVRGCAASSAWCEVEVSTYRGWLKRDEFYGVYPNEAVGG